MNGPERHSATVRHLRPVIIRTPQEKAALGRLRRRMEKAVERMLTVLDELAGDPDLEEGGDDEDGQDAEPDLGWTSTIRQQGQNWQGGGEKANYNHDNELDTADEEPSLGSLERHPVMRWACEERTFPGDGSQETWGYAGNTADLEDEHDGSEEEPDEASLGWTAGNNQDGGNHWWGGMGDFHIAVDAELDTADREPSMGAQERHPALGWGTFNLPGYLDQTHWGTGATDDREDDGDDREEEPNESWDQSPSTPDGDSAVGPDGFPRY